MLDSKEGKGEFWQEQTQNYRLPMTEASWEHAITMQRTISAELQPSDSRSDFSSEEC